ncbi:hypothetical protein J8281_10190 [Aquimarina sp. U1-2]|uniref:hypothetical protein n=1 Tax=Aquimarina sp. U1-2 TaxID=2823141 RepID=UPI001AECE79A|nr:hypothetical protein [Aquimarina sp. U1-2]MBP2832553.1 hypothetical protein [Aquimarina sp. U1-2]
MNLPENIVAIKSVTIRSIAINRRLLISSSEVQTFESFLKDTIKDEVLVVNTNIGIEVYYHSSNDYGNFIKESVLLYTLKRVDPAKLKFRNNNNRSKVYQSFYEALLTFAKYPQLFLAYTKKFIHIKNKHSASTYIIPVLTSFFEEVLRILEDTDNLPHSEKIKSANDKLHRTRLDKSLIKSLISEILLKSRYN